VYPGAVKRTLPILLLLALAAGGCSVDAPPAGALSQAVGEPMNGFPSPAERLGLMAINRARSDPQTVKGPQSAAYPAVAPVGWSYALNRSARFHSTNLEQSKVTLMHTSPCPLNANVASANCSGAPACACAQAVPASCANCANVAAVNNCGTDTFTRIGYFTAGTQVAASGEVAAAGYADPMAVVDGWMDEPAGADGHRRNLTDQGISSNVMGYGHATGTGCWSPFDVSDSGDDGAAQSAKIPTAAVNPPSGGAGSFTFYASWADPAQGAPASLNVVVDGNCMPLARELGTDKLNATYKTSASLAAGCHSYWILAHDAGGARLTYPSSGALTISVGGAACAGDYLAQAPAAGCEGGPPPDLAVPPTADLAVPPGADLAVPPGADLAVPPGRDLAAPPGSDLSGMAGIGEPCTAHADCASHVCALDGSGGGYCTQPCDPLNSSCPSGFSCGLIGTDPYCLRSSAAGCSCSIAQRGASPSGIWALALVALLALATRRRPAGPRTGN
jgi:MYXO-CTERM domain-containing protein